MLANRAVGDALALLSLLATVKRVASVAAFCPLAEGAAMLWGRRRDSGKWTTPGGGLESREPPALGAAREFRQETGRHVHAGNLVPLAERRAPNGCLLYFFRLWFAEPFAATGALDPDQEVVEWRWWPSKDGHLPTELTANLHHRPNLILPLVEEILTGIVRGPDAEQLGLSTTHDPHSGKFMSGPSHGGGDLHHEGKKQGAHDFSRHSPKDLVAAYHSETKAQGMWTKRADGKMGRSERMDAIMGELSKRMKADGVTKKKLLIDDLDRWAHKQPLIRRNPSEG